jgi:hypothetical protein
VEAVNTAMVAAARNGHEAIVRLCHGVRGAARCKTAALLVKKKSKVPLFKPGGLWADEVIKLLF